jgi:ATP adenylyltransferase
MDYLWSPWRYQYLTAPPALGGCIFCQKASEQKDAENLVVWRGQRNFVLLNLFPYTSGHLMIAPYEHVARLEDAREETVAEMMLTARAAERHLRAIYRPGGLNLGMNVGRAAGAGIEEHIHMHVLPRWVGDSNFMTVVGETRVLPENLEVTYEKLSRAFAGEAWGAAHESQSEG